MVINLYNLVSKTVIKREVVSIGFAEQLGQKNALSCAKTVLVRLQTCCVTIGES